MSSVGRHASSGRASFNGSVSVMASLKPRPCSTTPHRCSVAYLTSNDTSGYSGSGCPARTLRFWSACTTAML